MKVMNSLLVIAGVILTLILMFGSMSPGTRLLLTALWVGVVLSICLIPLFFLPFSRTKN